MIGYIFLNCIANVLNNGINIDRSWRNNAVITNIDITNRQKILRTLGNIAQSEKDIIDMLIDEAVILQIAKNNNEALTVQQINELKGNIAMKAGFKNYYDLTFENGKFMETLVA